LYIPAPWLGNRLRTEIGGEQHLQSPFTVSIATFLCPSDPEIGRGSGETSIKPRSYVMSIGDTVPAWDWTNNRGLFRYNRTRGPHSSSAADTSFVTIRDGTSNTIILSETAIGRGDGDRGIKSAVAMDQVFNVYDYYVTPQECLSQARGPNNMLAPNINPNNGNDSGTKGHRWADSRTLWSAYSHFLPPNSPSCGPNQVWCAIAASSYHPGGVSAALADGAVRFVTDSVDAGRGDLLLGRDRGFEGTHAWEHYRGPSTYGVWGAMGTVSGGESASL